MDPEIGALLGRSVASQSLPIRAPCRTLCHCRQRNSPTSVFLRLQRLASEPSTLQLIAPSSHQTLLLDCGAAPLLVSPLHQHGAACDEDRPAKEDDDKREEDERVHGPSVRLMS